MGIIVYNGISSRSYGILVETEPGYPYPEKDVEMVHVPGRNGDIAIETGSYKNVEVSYNIAAPAVEESYSMVANRVVTWLHSARTYARLEDSYDPDIFRLALYKEEGNFSSIFRKAGRAEIKFDCKPQRFLKSGERVITTTSSLQLANQTNQDALPIIIVYGTGSGTLTIGSYTINISAINTYTAIDCDTMNCYTGTTNRNNYVTMPSGFPRLIPGMNNISFSGNVTKIDIKPRWWIL